MNLLHFQDVLENGGLAVQNVVVLVFSTSPRPLCQLPLSSFGGSLPSPAPTQSGLLYDHPSQGAEEGIDSSNFYHPKDINFQNSDGSRIHPNVFALKRHAGIILFHGL